MIKLQKQGTFKRQSIHIFIFAAWLAHCYAPLIVRTIKFGNTKLDIWLFELNVGSFGMVKLLPPTVQHMGYVVLADVVV